MNLKVSPPQTAPARGNPALAALESVSADLRLALDWRRLLALAFNATSTAPAGQKPLLTLVTYCYAANLLSSEDIEAAAYSEADVVQIAGDTETTIATLRQFRRRHRMLIEGCLGQVFAAALLELSGEASRQEMEVDLAASEFARRRLDLALLLDTAISE